MISTTIFPGRYVQGYDALKRLGKEMSRFGKKGLLICTPSFHDRYLGDLSKELEKTVSIEAVKFDGESSDEEIKRLLKISKKASCEVIVGIGGGKTLDTAKAVSCELKMPVVMCPTIASSDAPTSAVACIYSLKGELKRNVFLPRNPDLVLVDTRIIVQAPVRFLVAGMGDALSTWFEAESCQRKYAPNTTGDLGSITAYALARLCYDTLLEYGLAAKLACEVKAVTPAFEHIVEANVLLSGLGFESGGLAAAHSIHMGLTHMEQTHHFYHGEKVAIGTLASLFLTDKPQRTIDEVFGFCESVGLPTSLADLGLADISDEELMKMAEISCEKDKFMQSEPTEVTPQAVFFAFKAMDATGRGRKGK